MIDNLDKVRVINFKHFWEIFERKVKPPSLNLINTSHPVTNTDFLHSMLLTFKEYLSLASFDPS